MISMGVVSYGTAAVAFALLTLLLAVSWRGRRAGMSLITASLLTTVWATVLALVSATQTPAIGIFITEMLRNAGWLLALIMIAGSVAPKWLSVSGRVLCAVVASASVGFPILVYNGVVIGDAVMILSRSGLLVTLLGLVLLEQIYRNASDTARPALRFLAMGVGTMLAYDLFLYSQAELLRGITAEAWYARGIVNAIAVPLVAVAARRSPQWSLDVFVSRQVVFYTTSFVGVGAYLLLMSLGGYYVREIGGQWGRVGQILFFVGAIVVLLFLIASAPLRRHARVFISKHFYRNKYDYRVEWLRFIRTLSPADEDESVESDVRRTSIRAIAQIFGSPAGLLYTYDEASRRFTPAAAWPMRLEEMQPLADVPTDDDLARFLARTKWVIDLEELRNTPDAYDNIALPEWIASKRGLRLIAPLLQVDALVGLIMLYDPPPPFELTYEDRDLIKTVGRHVATHLAQQDADRRLAESRQFEAYNRLTAFMMHDLKNSVAQLQLLVANAERHRRNPEFIDDAIATIANTGERMRRLIEQLRGNSTGPRLQRLDIVALTKDVVARCSERLPKPMLRTAGEQLNVLADSERLTSIVEHLIRNAQDASTEQGSIEVELKLDSNQVLLIVSDTGSGMTPEFIRERLFRPFDSTKGSKGMGIGAYQVREYVRSLDGQLEVQSSPGIGTRFYIRLPLMAASQPARDTVTLERVSS
jgi:putative PEP-CTERM system histidine kinase